MTPPRPSAPDVLEHLVPPAYRQLFPITREWTYLQNASIGPLSTRVLDAVQRCLTEQAAAGTESYSSWLETAESVRRQAAALIKAPAECVSFVRNTAEGLSRIALGLPWKAGDNIITATIEYPTNVMPWRALDRVGVETRILPAPDGRVEIDDIVRAADAHTRMVAISSIQFSSGFRIDLARLGTFCRERGILLSVDAIHTLGVFPLDVGATPVDFVSAGGHKWLLSPVGTGIFYTRPELLDLLRVIEVGAAGDARYHVQDELLLHDFVPHPSAKRFEGGVPPFALLAGMGAAIALALEIGVDRIARHVLALADRAAAGLAACGCRILSPRADEAEKSAIVVFVHPRASSETLKRALTAERISVSLRTVGGRAVLRAAPHFYNDASDIARLVETVAQTAGEGRR
ncbi:MAG TPA: aminotransferase class V-fold PLP-dependent enzyme [bacterium]|nr:aminotransferase class V-fold PLP-dependent enzyme [bacterium]